MTGYRDPWPDRANVADAEIIDRRAYEQLCLAFIKHYADAGGGRWSEGGLELVDASLVGTFPDTELRVVFNWPALEHPEEFKWPIWHGDGEARVRSKGDEPSRWTPSQLISDYLEDIYYMID